MRTKWSKKLVVQEIRKLRRAGEKMNPWNIQQHYHPLYLAARNYWGSYKKALRAAGYSYERSLKPREATKWGKSRIVQIIQASYQNGERLNSNHIQLHLQLLYAAALKYFGSWQKAIEAAGYDYVTIRVKQPFRLWSKLRIIQTIRKRQRSGQPLNTTLIIKHDGALYVAAKRYFGPKNGWKKALQAAGIDLAMVYIKPRWTKRLVRNGILALKHVGVPLSASYLRTHGHTKLVCAGNNLYGSWARAVSATGLNYTSIQRKHFWGKETIKREIRRLCHQGIRLSSKAMQRSRGDLFGAAVANFGNWGTAVEAAGISYREHSSYWTYKSWLKSLTPQKVQNIQQRIIAFTQKERVGSCKK